MSSYSHYVFSALDQTDSGVITFEVDIVYWWKVLHLAVVPFLKARKSPVHLFLTANADRRP